jgi:hypothetical protein
MRFARWVFTAAGVYGLFVVAPLYFLEEEVARRTGPISHPELYYGFTGVVLACQLVYLLIGRDPARYRPVIPLMMLGKLSFGVATWALCLAGRTPALVAATATPDLVWVVLFGVAYAKTPKV